MKKMILAASLLAMLTITTPVLAVEAHHPENQGTQVDAQTDTSKMDASVQQMQEMRKKIETEKKPAARKDLMHQHMRMMKDGMNMMTMMGGKGGMMGGMMGGAASGNPTDDRMGMLEKKMMMMQEMLNGMMMQQEMMMK
jgi:hypothetical protein